MEDTEPLSIRNLYSVSTFRIKCEINEVKVNCVLDTGASWSILANSAFDKLKEKPPTLKTTMVNAAAINQQFEVRLVGPVRITVGNCVLFRTIYVGPIKDEMLLGLDLLKELGGKIDVGSGTFHCRNEPVPITKYYTRNTSVKARLAETITIPPFTEMITSIECPGMGKWEYCYLEPRLDLPVSVASALYKGGNSHSVCLVNNNHLEWKLKMKTELGEMLPLYRDEILDLEPEFNINSVSSEYDQGSTTKELPDNLKPLLDTIDPSLSADEKDRLKLLLIKYETVFAKDEFDLGEFDSITHKINTVDEIPIKMNQRRTPIHFVESEEVLINKLLDAGIIQASTSSFAACPVLIKKRGGGLRYCIDYRLLNKRTIRDSYPLPLLSECIDSLSGNLWFSKLDCNSAYYQIPMDPDSKHKTAFITRLGLFEFNKMPMGLSNAPSSYARAIGLVLRGLNWKSVLSFLDDVCVLGSTTEMHLKNLEEVLNRFKIHNMKFKPAKCRLFCKEIEFLGRKINEKGITLTDYSIDTIRNWREPASIKDVEIFLGLANFHRAFIKDFSRTAEPMFRLLKKKIFVWGDDQQKSFKKLCEDLISPAVLAIPTREGRFFLDCDSCNVAIGAQLSQEQNGVKRVIAYGSFALSKPQISYCSSRKELLSCVRFCIHFRHYILGREFTLTSDCFSLKWLCNFKNMDGQLSRWAETLSQYNFEMVYRPGKNHISADSLSRRPIDDPCLVIKDVKSLPCGGCKHCTRVHNKWVEFENQVGEASELAFSTKEMVSNSRVSFYEEPRFNCVNPVVSDAADSDEPVVMGIDKEEIVREQRKDNIFKFLFNFILNKVEPDEQELKLSSEGEIFYFMNRSLFSLKNQVLYQTVGVANHLLVVPEGLKNEVLRICHDIPSSGHMGIDRTKALIKERYIWFRMSKDIRNYVISCDVCNKNKNANRPARHPRVIDHAGYPMQKIHMDHLGPLPATDAGNNCILVIIDNFTKWVEAIPLPNQTAETTAHAAVNHFFCRFGYPVQIVSDQGKAFEANLFSEVCKLLQIRKSRTSGYRASANGQAERQMRVLGAAIRCFVSKNKKDWDKFVPLIASAMRSAVNRHTGFSANKLMLGRELFLPADIAVPDERMHPTSPEQYVVLLRKNLELAHSIARDVLKVQLKLTKKGNDTNCRMFKYKVGDAIYFLDRAPRNKLCPKWCGPGIITKVFSPQTLEIQLKNLPNLKVVSHDYLKPCVDRVLPAWIVKAQKSIQLNEPRSYCSCGRPDNGLLMIQCCQCLDWFHGECIGVSKNKAKEMKEYLCERCVTQSQSG